MFNNIKILLLKKGFKAVVVMGDIETVVKEKHSLSSRNFVKL